MNRGFIICVDDEQAILNQLSAQLERHFGRTHDVEVAESAEEALEVIDELARGGGYPELVISDQIMPGMKGDKFLEAVHHHYPQAMKILLTGQAGLESAIYAINNAGLHRYIEKPWTEEDLVMSARGLLRQFKYSRDLHAMHTVALELQTLLEESQVVDFLPQAVNSLLGTRQALLALDAAGPDSATAQPQISFGHGWQVPQDPGEVYGFLQGLWPLLRAHRAARLVRRGEPGWPVGAALLPPPVDQFLLASLWGGGALMGGLLLAGRPGGEPFGDEDATVLTLLATQVGGTLKRIQLHKRLQNEILLRATYERYLSRPVAERLISHPEEGWQMDGKERDVTVIFADLRGFTALAEGQTPQLTVSVLNRWLSAMTPLVFDAEGTLDKYIGDSIMAIFGAPFPQEDHHLRAIHCAVHMQQRMDQLNQELLAEFGLTLNMGIGINSGRVTAGNIGSEQRLEYTVIGDAVNVAARLEANATAGKIFMSRAVWDKVHDDLLRDQEALGIRLGELETLMIKGKALEIEAIQVLRRRGTGQIVGSS